MKRKSVAAVALMTLAVVPNLGADEIKLDSTMDNYSVGSGIEFSLDYTSNISVPQNTEITKDYLYENGYVDYNGYITANGSEANSNLFVTSDTYAVLNTEDYDQENVGTYQLSIDFVDGQDESGLHYSTAKFNVIVGDASEGNLDDVDPLTPSVDAESGKLNRLSDEYKVGNGIDFSLAYTSDIKVMQGTEITKEYLYENGYVDYNGFITSNGSQANSNLFVTSDTYAVLNLNDYDQDATGTYTLSIDFVDGQDDTGLHYTTVPFNVAVEKEDNGNTIDPLTPSVDVEEGKLNRLSDEYKVGNGIEFSLAYTSNINVEKNTEITKEFLYENGYVDYSGYITSNGSNVSSDFFITSDYAILNTDGYNKNVAGKYDLSIDFVDGQDDTGVHYTTVPFTVTVK